MFYKGFPIFSFKLLKIILFFPFSTSQKWCKGTPEKTQELQMQEGAGTEPPKVK